MTPKVEAAIARLMSGSAFCDHADIRALISAYREAERDAARYRWLKKATNIQTITLWNNIEGEFEGLLSGTALCEHIDAAIAKGGSRAG